MREPSKRRAKGLVELTVSTIMALLVIAAAGAVLGYLGWYAYNQKQIADAQVELASLQAAGVLQGGKFGVVFNRPVAVVKIGYGYYDERTGQEFGFQWRDVGKSGQAFQWDLGGSGYNATYVIADLGNGVYKVYRWHFVQITPQRATQLSAAVASALSSGSSGSAARSSSSTSSSSSAFQLALALLLGNANSGGSHIIATSSSGGGGGQPVSPPNGGGDQNSGGGSVTNNGGGGGGGQPVSPPNGGGDQNSGGGSVTNNGGGGGGASNSGGSNGGGGATTTTTTTQSPTQQPTQSPTQSPDNGGGSSTSNNGKVYYKSNTIHDDSYYGDLGGSTNNGGGQNTGSQSGQNYIGGPSADSIVYENNPGYESNSAVDLSTLTGGQCKVVAVYTSNCGSLG